MNFSTNCHEGVTKQRDFCVAHLSEGLSTVKAASFLIQDFSISDTWSRTSSYRHKVCKTNIQQCGMELECFHRLKKHLFGNVAEAV